VASIGEKAESDARMLQYGWSSEQTAQTYNVRHTREIVKKVMRADGEELATHLKKGKKKHE